MTLRTDDFDYELPPELIATRPADRRDQSRLLVLRDGRHEHAVFAELVRHLPPRSLLVLNDTRVLAARLRARKPSGGAVELLLVRRLQPPSCSGGRFAEEWEALARGLGKAAPATSVALERGCSAVLLEHHERGAVRIRIEGPGEGLLPLLPALGEIPLPPYIEAARRKLAQQGTAAPACDDADRYQTVFAAVPGAVAAPTAGLHFTPALLDELRGAGHEIATLTLHVGPGTFRPVEAADPREHRMDEELYDVPEPTVAAVRRARAEGRAVVAVGTTVTRTLEAAARGGWRPGPGATRLYLLPGDEFMAITHLITNFHLPRSTLLMLVCALAGRERVMDAYGEAIARGYRFYSYGDAMLVEGAR